MQDISLVATDLDGTLFYNREQITDRDRSMLYRLKDAGIILAFATGRELNLVAPALDRLQLWDAPAYIIHSGGSGLFHVHTHTDRQLAAMSPETLRDIYKRHGALNISFIFMKDGVMHTDKLTDILKHESELLCCPVKQVDDFAALLTQPNGKLVACGTEAQLELVLPRLTEDADTRYQFHRSHDNYIDCYARGATKGSALQLLCGELDIPISASLAIGDNLNDRQLLETAGHSACPGDGHPEIRALADFVACPAYEGAFAAACEHFIFSK